MPGDKKTDNQEAAAADSIAASAQTQLPSEAALLAALTATNIPELQALATEFRNKPSDPLQDFFFALTAALAKTDASINDAMQPVIISFFIDVVAQHLTDATTWQNKLEQWFEIFVGLLRFSAKTKMTHIMTPVLHELFTSPQFKARGASDEQQGWLLFFAQAISILLTDSRPTAVGKLPVATRLSILQLWTYRNACNEFIPKDGTTPVCGKAAHAIFKDMCSKVAGLIRTAASQDDWRLEQSGATLNTFNLARFMFLPPLLANIITVIAENDKSKGPSFNQNFSHYIESVPTLNPALLIPTLEECYTALNNSKNPQIKRGYAILFSYILDLLSPPLMLCIDDPQASFYVIKLFSLLLNVLERVDVLDKKPPQENSLIMITLPVLEAMYRLLSNQNSLAYEAAVVDPINDPCRLQRDYPQAAHILVYPSLFLELAQLTQEMSLMFDWLSDPSKISPAHDGEAIRALCNVAQLCKLHETFMHSSTVIRDWKKQYQEASTLPALKQMYERYSAMRELFHKQMPAITLALFEYSLAQPNALGRKDDELLKLPFIFHHYFIEKTSALSHRTFCKTLEAAQCWLQILYYFQTTLVHLKPQDVTLEDIQYLTCEFSSNIATLQQEDPVTYYLLCFIIELLAACVCAHGGKEFVKQSPLISSLKNVKQHLSALNETIQAQKVSLQTVITPFFKQFASHLTAKLELILPDCSQQYAIETLESNHSSMWKADPDNLQNELQHHYLDHIRAP